MYVINNLDLSYAELQGKLFGCRMVMLRHILKKKSFRKEDMLGSICI